MSYHQLVKVAACAAAGLLMACGPPPADFKGASGPRRGPAGSLLREDRVVLTRGTIIRAVGATRRWVFALTPEAVIVYDRDRRLWLPPFTREGAFDPAIVRSMALDPTEESAWLITPLGTFELQPALPFLMRASTAPPVRVRVASLDDVYREFPSLESFGRLLTRDDATLETYPVVAGARAPDRSEVWLGTAGGGLFDVDPLFNRATPWTYGLATSGAGALALAADGVWMAPAARGVAQRLALTFASRDLQHWRWLDDASRRGFGGARGTSLSARGDVLWMGTTRGLYRIPVNGPAAARAFVPQPGLPSDVVLSVLAREHGVWVGTDRGLAFVPTDSARARESLIEPDAAQGTAVRALLATGDTLWVGSDAGLLLRPPGGGALVRPAAIDKQPRLREPVVGLAVADSTVFVAVSDGVLTFSLRRGTWREPWPAAVWRQAGPIEALAADAQTVWAGGALGAVALDRRTGRSRTMRLGSDLPDAVTDIVLDGPWAWIATVSGVVRVRRLADGLP